MSQAEKIVIADAPMRWQDVVAVARHGAQLELSAQTWARIENAQGIVQRIVASGERAYGVNTGLGALCNVSLKDEQLSQLSRNTLLSHACGVGPVLADEQARAIMCAAIRNYSHGKSGIHRRVVEALLALLNRGITPQVPSQGSVGYLTHMAHIGIALLGVGNVSYRGQIVSAQQALAEAVQWADVIGAMSFEAQRGQIAAFDAEIIALKPHPGMQQVGVNLRALLDGSEVIAASKGIRTQDALSIRSIPQVHGAARDQLEHAIKQIETELNGCTDNPLLLGTPDDFRVMSQANPHGQSVALAADLLAIAMAEIGSIAERRLDRLINPHVSGLPAFLVANPGVNSGMMIVQYVAASLCAENRQLAQPAVLDNYVTSGLQEDHLSMGTNAALKLHRALENCTQILAIEYLLAAQAFEFLKEQRFGAGTDTAWRLLREKVPAYDQDRWLAPDIAATASVLKDTDLIHNALPNLH